MNTRSLLLLILLLQAMACAGSTPAPAPPPSARDIPAPTLLPSAERLVAVGDLHGDMMALQSALRLASVLDDEGHWSGGETVVVQVGDQLDRGDDEREILDFLERLADEAHRAGGALLILVGNHEAMNVELDLRYVTDAGWTDFAEFAPDQTEDPVLLEHEEHRWGRVQAFRPAGPYAQLLSGHNVVQVVGDTVFVHGGLLPEHIGQGLDRINNRVRNWMNGTSESVPTSLLGSSGPLWVRDYSDATDEAACGRLREVLDSLELTRMVVGHTVQDSINEACDGAVWRIDTGMSRYYGGTPSVLEIRGDQLRVLTP